MEKTTVSPNDYKYQVLGAISANLIMIGFGSGMGWLNPALPMLQSKKSPMESGALGITEVSWIGSILSLGCLIGNFAVGYTVTVIGSRNTIMALGIPQLCSWLLMTFGTHAHHLYISRFLSGFVGGGSQISVSLYVAEIADNDVRGRLGTFLQFSRNFGILLAYLLGFHFDYIKASVVFAVVTIIFCGTFFFLPSTPQYLLEKEKPEEAEDSFKFYKGYKGEDNSTFDMTQFENIKAVTKEVQEDSNLTIKDLWEARKGLVQAVVIPLLNQLAASYIFLTYGTKIIEKSGTHLPVETASISLAVVTLIGTTLTSQLVDSKGRKFLLIFSMAGCMLGHAVMIAYLYMHQSGIDTSLFHWTPVICMASVVLLASAGIVPLTFICLVEAFPPKVRSFGVTFGNVAINIFAFTISKSFPILSEAIGLTSCLIIFCVGCGFGVFFIVFCVDETKSKELNVSTATQTRLRHEDAMKDMRQTMEEHSLITRL